jgi:hypothetical protein
MLHKSLIGACGKGAILGLILGLIMSAPALATVLSGPEFKNHDISAAKKKQRRHVYSHRPAPPAYARYWFRDPSLAPDGRPYRNPYPPGTCTTDLGYGRFASCDSERK